MTDASRGPDTLEPGVVRLTANNPSAFTERGTQSYIVGASDVAVIDPGPAGDEAHLAALLGAIAGRRVVAVMCTHTHRDHSPLSRDLAKATGGPIVGCAPLALSDEAPRADASFDHDYAADRVLADGDSVSGEGWELTAITTPGHASNHLCFALGSGALFSGDHVMGWSTSIVSPSDGAMGDYMASLDKLLERDDRIYYPGHGPAVEQPHRLVRGMMGHRKQREGQILRLIDRGTQEIDAMVAAMYPDVRLHRAAERSVLAHLLDLRARGLVSGEEGAAWTRT
jgi:glyoxylase-like metal-dependent hydrolase (beta-lactamase superfamily II)